MDELWERNFFIQAAEPDRQHCCPMCGERWAGSHECRDVVVMPAKRLTPEPNGRSGICSCGKRFRIGWLGYASRKWVKHVHNPVADDAGNVYVLNA